MDDENSGDGRIAFGEEARSDRSGVVSYVPTGVEFCPDCGVRYGEHHDPGCHLEQCPICRESLVQCGHRRQVPE